LFLPGLSHMLIHQALEYQAERRPHASAITDESQTMTYGYLNCHANVIGWFLRERGIGPGKAVAVAGEVSPALIAAVFGVMKTGACFVYLDPTWPSERRRSIFTGAQAAFLLTSGEVRQDFKDTSTPSSEIDAIFRDYEFDAPNLNLAGDVRDLAFVCFTSGSTGNPKGVLCTHESIVNRLQWFQQQFPYGPGDVACLRARLSFVISAWELFGPLMAGIRLVLLPSSKEPIPLLRAMRDQCITHIGLVPSLAAILVEHYREDLARLKAVRLVEIGGASSSSRLIAKLIEALPSAQIINRYGSTEMVAVVFQNLSDRDAHCGRILVGCPITNVRAHIVESDIASSQEGVAGELCLAGAGLAWGYLNDVAGTATRFVPNPFGVEAGERLYRTGDLAKAHANGIELIGRIDFQIKIAGFRIEPGEIETALLEHPRVDQVVVLGIGQQATSYESGSGQQETTLVACVVPSNGVEVQTFESTLATEWRIFLRERLPDYMIPGWFLMIPSVPLLPNGKIDRRGLTDQALQAMKPYRANQALQAMREKILDSFAVTLDLPLSALANRCFLDLGGNSIQAMKIIAILMSKYGLELQLSELLGDASLSSIADELSQKLHRDGHQS
jgi:amino acid adenylation domain-containing protein